jgi:signal transduction histidine kinase
MPQKRHAGTQWWISHLRWALLLAIFFISSLDPAQRSVLLPVYTVLLVGGLYSLAVVLLLYRGRTPRHFGELTLALDTFVLLSITYVSQQPSYFLLCLFPIVVAALWHGIETSLLLASLVTSAYAGFVFFLQPWLAARVSLPSTMVGILALFLGAIIPAMLGSRLGGERAIGTFEEEPPSAAYRDRFRAIYEMTGELIRTLNYQLILERMLDVSLADFKESAQRNLQRPVSMVLFFDEDQDNLYVAASRNLSKTDELKRIKGETGLVAHVLSAGEPARSTRPGSDRELTSFRALRRCRSVLCVPLRAGLELYGVALFGSPQPSAFGDAYMELITAFCNQVSIALQNAELFRDLQEERKRVLFSDEELRKQLARELHDGPTQSISSVAMRLDFIRTLLDSDPPRAREELSKLERLAGQAVKEVRTMLFSMRPMLLETQGLAAALEHYADRIEETDEVEVHISAEQLKARPVPLVEGATFFILEEAINNAKKHAMPNHIWVRLGSSDGELLAQVQDDGEGFNVAEVESAYEGRASLGLVNMRERARLINGTLTIESKPGEGTIVTLIAPLTGEEPVP